MTDVLGDDADEDGYTGAVNTAAAVLEPSEVAASQPAEASADALALQPDDNGYRGPVDRAAQADIAPSEMQPAEAPDWEQFFAEPQPDQDSYANPLGLDDRSPDDWSSFRYLNVAGATLRPRDSSSGWDYSGTGCVSRSSGSELINIHLPIPDGSRIDYLRIYYYDSSSSDSRAWVTNYNSSGGYTDVTTVTSSGSSGYGTQLSAYPATSSIPRRDPMCSTGARPRTAAACGCADCVSPTGCPSDAHDAET
ncbi:MAG: hypothetical protein R2844_16230 [Caldilineales bacterium]